MADTAELAIVHATTASASWLTDPTVFAVNRKPAHSNHRYFLGEATEPKQNLDGVWKVNVTQAASIDVENAPFAAADFNDAGFGAINVPEHLQMAGYLKNKYVNVQYPWDGHEDPQEPNVPETNHVALYRRTFTVAERLDAARQNGGTVSITFHGMATAIYVWVNGVFVGYGEDGYTPERIRYHPKRCTTAKTSWPSPATNTRAPLGWKIRISGVCTACSVPWNSPHSRMCTLKI